MVMGFLGEISKVMFEVLKQDTKQRNRCVREGKKTYIRGVFVD